MDMDHDLDWKSISSETVANLTRLIQAETVNPPGNELPAILVVKQILEKDGLDPEDFKILESAPRRVNLVARLRGDGSQRPLMLSGHVDVVPVEREKWSHDPFGGELIDGEVWGRGALDMKGFLAMYLQVFLEVRRRNLPLKRDLILAAVADEENGFAHGSRFLAEQHPDLINAEYALTEGGAFPIYLGKTKAYMIQVAEKGMCWLRMTATGKPGHGSLPHEDNAVVHLARAVDSIRRAGHLPVHVTQTFSSMLKAASRQVRWPVGMLAGWLANPGLARLALGAVKGQAHTMLTAMLTNTCTPTVLKAGSKTNVIPSTAEVHLDCRKLPGQSVDDVQREVMAACGGGVSLEPMLVTDGAEVSAETPLYAALERCTRKMDAQGIIIPFLMPGATDACQYRKAGIQTYGFTPGYVPPEFPTMTLGHGHDERLPVAFIESGLPALWDVINEVCVK
jgi:acetylornithine deacetylase/succinyl-diaminopimelate desuccinylase-like protein